MTVSLSCALPPTDRVQPLISREVVPEGLQLDFICLPVEELFLRQTKYSEFDVCEYSLSTYVTLRDRGDDRFIALPVFTSRFFRHSSLYVNVKKGIKTPEDLAGKRVGVPEYGMTSAIWLRGIFQDEYGLTPDRIHWCRGGNNRPGRQEKVALSVPGIQVEEIPAGQTLSRMLEQGEIDALITSRPPACFIEGSPQVTRLFPNSREVEEAYFKKTGIFPIMHTIMIKTDVYRRHPWIAVNLYQAFNRAKDMTLRNYRESPTLIAALPWLISEIERTTAVMGEDWWPYGVPGNQKTLETFLRYHHEQGLSQNLMPVDALFAPETTEI